MMLTFLNSALMHCPFIEKSMITIITKNKVQKGYYDNIVNILKYFIQGKPIKNPNGLIFACN